MKKFASLVLALAMAAVCAAPAMAEGADSSASSASSGTTTELDANSNTGETKVEFEIKPAYTVTIPQTIELDKITDTTNSTVTYKKDLTLTASNMRLNKDQTLKVTIPTDPTNPIFTLTSSEGATLNCKITLGENNTSVPADGVVAAFVTSTDDQTATLHIEAADPQFAGKYSGTLNFTIALDPNT